MSQLPVIMLTAPAASQLRHRIGGWKLGADVTRTKPFVLGLSRASYDGPTVPGVR